MFSPKALVLLLETRVCRQCGDTAHTVPALEPRVRVENHRGESTTISLQEYHKHLTGDTAHATHRLKWFNTELMPREIQHARVEMAQCLNCFAEGEERTEAKRAAFDAYRRELSFLFGAAAEQRERDLAIARERAELARREAYTAVKRKPGSGKHKRAARARDYTATLEEFK